jgi:hypothetical protein
VVANLGVGVARKSVPIDTAVVEVSTSTVSDKMSRRHRVFDSHHRA